MKIANKIIMIILLVILGLSIEWPLKLVTGIISAINNIANGIVRVIKKEILKLDETQLRNDD